MATGTCHPQAAAGESGVVEPRVEAGLLESRRDLPGIDELRAAGLLDPVEDALAAAMEVQGEAEAEAADKDEGDEWREESAD